MRSVDKDRLEVGIAGNVQVYLLPEEIRATVGLLLKYPTSLPEDVLSAMEKMEKSLDQVA